MTIEFNINYGTSWGETIRLMIIPPEGEAMVCVMSNDNNNNWMLQLDLPTGLAPFKYCYQVYDGEELMREEWGEKRNFEATYGEKSYILQDTWRDIPSNKVFYSTPFSEVFWKRKEDLCHYPNYNRSVTISIFAPYVTPDQEVILTGDSDELGGWDINQAVIMHGEHFPLWRITLDAQIFDNAPQFKFAIVERKSRRIISWESEENRLWLAEPIASNTHYHLSGLEFRGIHPSWRGAGVAIPVFSLRSEQSAGIGDFTDLRRFVDWACLTGQRIIQLLPVNDTTLSHTWVDSYPYRSISIFALHPIYLSIDEMGTLEDKELVTEIATERQRLNNLNEIDYEGVESLKWKFFRAIYAQTGDTVLKSEEYQKFFDRNKDWLKPYALFSYLRDKYNTPIFSLWGEWSTYDPTQAEEMYSSKSEAFSQISFYYFLQYHLDKQLTETHNYARSKAIALKGDIPIGISRESVEAWTLPHLFNMNGQAGAPPDDFSVEGQNWSFPTYNWEEMAKDGYAWWKRRFEKMADYFDLYRIDHILGFFRIWEIPLDSVQGLLGHFNPSLPFSHTELNNWGLPMQYDRYTQPFIHESFLPHFFGEEAHQIDRYLEHIADGYYRLRPEYNTQIKVQQHFAESNDVASNRIKRALYGLINEVLFIEDDIEKGLFHPRITAQFTYSYKYLSEYERHRFDALYNHFFYHRHNDYWKAMAMRKLPPLIDATNMMVCAEDLGMIPACVPDVMNHLQIVTLEVQRMPKNPKLLFGYTHTYPYLSVSTPSSHDTSTLRGWWQENRTTTQRYYNEMLWKIGEAPIEATSDICTQILKNHLDSPSILTIIPLQDWFGIDELLRVDDPNSERINIPSNPIHYWRYRMHLSIEQLMNQYEFNNKVSQIVYDSGR